MGGNVCGDKWSFDELIGHGADWSDWRDSTGTVRNVEVDGQQGSRADSGQ